MTSFSSLIEPHHSQDDDDDETYVNDHVELSDDSETSKGVQLKPTRKRKKQTKKNASQKKPKIGGERSKYWKFYDVVYLEEDDGVHRKYGKCKWCKEHIRADPIRNGTSGIKKHIPACDKNPDVDKKQTNLVFQKETSGECSVTIWKHDDSRITKSLLDLFIVAELPFKLVENPAFIEYTNALNGKYVLPSRHKMAKDIAKYYIEERSKLLAYVSKPTNTVHLTTDTWTSSCQRVNYMVLAAQFIDDDWGELDKLNDYMYFAIILDPTMKLFFIEHCYEDMIISNKSNNDNWTVDDIKKMVATKLIELESKLHVLFQTYKERLDKVDHNSASQEARNDDAVVVCDDGNEFFMTFLNKGGSQSACKETELQRYLKEQRVDFSMGFDILKWWKQNAIRFPIVSRMARDILAIQISTVASESAFSTGGRVLDAYRTRLSTSIVEALICTQDWVRKSKNPIVDDVDDILKDDDVAIEIEDAIQKQNEKGKGISHDKA